MTHPHHDDARKSHGDRLEELTGKRGEYPPDRAARILGEPMTSANATGDAARMPEEAWTKAPARQVSNRGNIKGD